MSDQLSMDLHDEELLVEIRLLTDLMIAANQADGRMAMDSVDLVLDVPAAVVRPLSMPPAQLNGHARPGHISDLAAKSDGVARRAVG
jgi:hypothetical protein